jgi:hypothetical protein
MSFTEIWDELDRESVRTGALQRRIRPEAPVDIHLVLHKPDNARSLRIVLGSGGSDADLPSLPATAGIGLDWSPGPQDGGTVLNVRLRSGSFADLFDRLIDDITAAAIDTPDPSEAGRRVIGRVRRWQSFLRDVPEGLDRQVQQGMFGELEFLETLLVPVVGAPAAVRGWTGGDRANQDFSLGHRAVEVKTTSARQHHVLSIASERQLDMTGLDTLIVVASTLDRRDAAGTTLPELIDTVRRRLASDEAALATFEDKLFDAGYSDSHRHLYRTGYVRRSRRIFAVTGGFPRITPATCPGGIADVRYSIAVDTLGPFEIDEDRAVALLGASRA